MNNFLRRILDFLSTRHCVLCGRAVDVGQDMSICGKCECKISALGKTSFSNGGITVSVLPYEGDTRRSIFKFKFRNKKYYGYTFGKLIGDRIKTFDWHTELDCVACVAIKGRKRMYNQAAVIAEQTANELQIPFYENALVKIKVVPSFYGLDAKERAKAVRGAFKAGNDSVKDKKVLLIDDISTTGVTLNECRNELLTAGANEVYCATACYVRSIPKKSM